MTAYSDNRIIDAIAYSHCRNITASTARHFSEMGITASDFLYKDVSELSAISSLPASAFGREKIAEHIARARSEYDFIVRNNIRPVYITDETYPMRLSACDDAPLMLYALGNDCWNKAHVLSIVGTRHCTSYGKNFVEALVKELAARIDDLVIVSGLAYGVDIAAHRAAIDNGIPTIAVVAHGLNTIYPADHRGYAQRIVADGGALLTEYCTYDAVHRGNFLARNRIVAGVAEATIIIESDVRGGAMSTARLAAEYSREVLALPGRTTDIYSRGCLKLISDGAAGVITCADDVIQACGWTPRPQEGSQTCLPLELTELQSSILNYLRNSSNTTVNDMAHALGIPYARLSAELFAMEMADLVTAVPGGRYEPL